jgi:hypothetical protein
MTGTSSQRGKQMDREKMIEITIISLAGIFWASCGIIISFILIVGMSFSPFITGSLLVITTGVIFFILYKITGHIKTIITRKPEPEIKRRLKEAQRVYERSFKEFCRGKISKEELKEKLRPYKEELKELGYPIKVKEDNSSE